MKSLLIKPGSRFRASDIDPDDTSLAPGDKTRTAAVSEKLQARIGELQELLYAGHHHKLLVILQGMDTSGKDGTIRHVLCDTTPQNIRVVAFKKPTEHELDHDYLWRVHQEVPGASEIVVFNRSHYEDVLIVRVHGFVPRAAWRKRYDQINDFERMLSENGVTILKFFLHISRDEQRERLQERLDDPTKRWKFQEGDLDERKLWNDYMRAYEDAITKTSTKWAPWIVVPANRKWYRNWVVASAITDALEKLDMEYPKPDLSKISVE
ncbi:MAG TPA: polyphosphate kinase 2 family protein [Thermoanaerobaculia bacterium]|nr:polyphosphate kinase 2 family protein [Thermoanaerobaculia bacterium]